MSYLKLREDVATPNCPFESTTTAVAPVTPEFEMPAMKALVWVPPVPMRMVPPSAVPPEFPI